MKKITMVCVARCTLINKVPFIGKGRAKIYTSLHSYKESPTMTRSLILLSPPQLDSQFRHFRAFFAIYKALADNLGRQVVSQTVVVTRFELVASFPAVVYGIRIFNGARAVKRVQKSM
ncbi:hypothetical protein VNO78_07790 [Psophocarpus tetragonolobus]|uniref:Uncharacterized protein n=1 Tax=Psophocarpus tetragonolobus TaxID=3891 RepID=A0AAN9SUU2_PSOTE